MIVMRALKIEGFAQSNIDGQYLVAFDVDANEGRGSFVFTPDVEGALRFADIAHALEAWKTQSTARPKRPDGHANRPLTAFTMTFEEAP